MSWLNDRLTIGRFFKMLCSALRKVIFSEKRRLLCGMYFKAIYRHNPKTDKSDWHYRLVETYEKVVECIGRLKQKYSSTHRRYKIEIQKQVVPVNDKNKSDKTKEICTALKWEKIAKADAQKQEECGQYFLRTSIKAEEGTLVWTVYNCIRNIESSFRTLKTDLDLRPVFHKSDETTQAHLHLGLLAYSVVNAVRFN